MSIFENNSLELNALPTLQATPFNSLSPRYRMINMSMTALLCVLICSVLTAILFQPLFALPEQIIRLYPYILTVVLLWGMLNIAYHFFADPLKQYLLREHDLTYASGLLFKKVRCQPILRIQHIEIRHSPTDRLAGLARLQVFSAGSAGGTFEIPGLEDATAQKLRKHILDHRELHRHG